MNGRFIADEWLINAFVSTVPLKMTFGSCVGAGGARVHARLSLLGSCAAQRGRGHAARGSAGIGHAASGKPALPLSEFSL